MKSACRSWRSSHARSLPSPTDPVAPQGTLDLREEANVLLRAESSHVTEAEDAVGNVSLDGRKEVCVHATLHREDGLSGACAKPFHVFLIRRQDHVRDLVEAQTGLKYVFLREIRQALPLRLRNCGSEFPEAPRRELVQVRVPRGHQRNPKIVRDSRAGDPYISWPRDMNHVRAKFAHRAQRSPVVAREEQIESQVQIE